MRCLLPVHNVVLNAPNKQGAEEARAIARTALDHYFSLTNYVNSWKRLGFTDADLASGPAATSSSTPWSPTGRPNKSPSASASICRPVPIMSRSWRLGVYDNPLPILAELAGPLGLSRQQA